MIFWMDIKKSLKKLFPIKLSYKIFLKSIYIYIRLEL